ncbi:MAG: transposase [Candidatus Delongbacteria bacterium]
MCNVVKIGAEIQVKSSNYLRKFKKYLDRPSFKFLEDGLNGMLRSNSIFISQIASHLGERISRKKTEERILYHLSKPMMSDYLTRSYLNANAKEISNQKYIIWDGSAIPKCYAKKMEGLAYVHDGASKKKNKLEIGYHWNNVVGVSKSESGEVTVFPIYSEIYSKELDPCLMNLSENAKLLDIHLRIKPYLSDDAIGVMDRGFDRKMLIDPLIQRGQSFIIRQTGRRHLEFEDGSGCESLKKISQKTELRYSYKVVQASAEKRIFKVGAKKVKFPGCSSKKNLWLVTAMEEGKGKTWFLSYLDTADEKEAVMTTMEGYTYRWKIEEYHRQIKQDFNLNKIKVMKYDTIKSLGVLLLVTTGFISKLFNMMDIDTKIKVLKAVNLVKSESVKNIPRYFYYKATEAIKMLLSLIFRKRKRKSVSNLCYYQPLLDL